MLRRMEEEAIAPPQRDRPEFVAALARGLAVIEVFSAQTPELSLSEVAELTHMSPATARRALLTLQELGYVGLTGKRFVLRPKVLSLGAAFLGAMNIRELVQPYLQEIADRSRDAASLAVLEGENVLYVAHVPNSRRIRFNASVGYRAPAFCTALGRVLWAYLSPEDIEDKLSRAPFPFYTGRTVTQADALRDVLAQVREQGYASQSEQLDYDVVSIAVPIRDSVGRVIAAINCSSELSRNDLDTLISTRLQPLRDTARQIEEGLQRFPALAHAMTP